MKKYLKKLRNHLTRDEYIYDPTQDFSDKVFTESVLFILILGALISAVLMAFVVSISGETVIKISTWVNIFLTGFTAAMGIAIFLQVRKESQYLENFEPSLQIMGSKPIKINTVNMPLQITVLNTSQTAVSVEEIRYFGFDFDVKVKGRPPESDSDVVTASNSIGIKPNSTIDLIIEPESDDNPFTEVEREKIIDQGFLSILIKGNFGEKMIKAPVED